MGTAAGGDLALAARPAPPPPAARASPSAAASSLAPSLSERGAPRRSRGPAQALGLSERCLYDPRVENTRAGFARAGFARRGRRLGFPAAFPGRAGGCASPWRRQARGERRPRGGPGRENRPRVRRPSLRVMGGAGPLATDNQMKRFKQASSRLLIFRGREIMVVSCQMIAAPLKREGHFSAEMSP